MLNKDFKDKIKELLESERERASLKTKVIELESKIADEKEQKQIVQKELSLNNERIGSLTMEVEEKKKQLSKLKQIKTNKNKKMTDV